MSTFLAIILALIVGFYFGKRAGIVLVMTRLQTTIDEMYELHTKMKKRTDQWNEDYL
jgi:hypothetical protein